MKEELKTQEQKKQHLMSILTPLETKLNNLQEEINLFYPSARHISLLPLTNKELSEKIGIGKINELGCEKIVTCTNTIFDSKEKISDIKNEITGEITKERFDKIQEELLKIDNDTQKFPELITTCRNKTLDLLNQYFPLLISKLSLANKSIIDLKEQVAGLKEQVADLKDKAHNSTFRK